MSHPRTLPTFVLLAAGLMSVPAPAQEQEITDSEGRNVVEGTDERHEVEGTGERHEVEDSE